MPVNQCTWTCESCGTENLADEEHCQSCDTWRSEQDDTTED